MIRPVRRQRFRCRRPGRLLRRSRKPALCGVAAGDGQGRFLRLELFEFYPSRRGRRTVPLTILVHTLPQGADLFAEIGTVQKITIPDVAVVLIAGGVPVSYTHLALLFA